jgi:Calcium/calmodulin dependent protein kinase II association domain
MKPFSVSSVIALVVFFATPFAAAADDAARLAELDRFWNAVSQSVKDGDFDGYKATCHPEGVLVSEKLKTSQPLTKALERWKPGFDDTKAGRAKASVEFRFSQRLGDGTTAHETGIFVYSFTDAQGQSKKDYVRFEALLVKRGGWKILMEYQKSAATAEEWAALKPAEGKQATPPRGN